MKDHFFVLQHLANENRHILSSWRTLLILQRDRSPYYTEDKAEKVIRKLHREELIESISGQTLYQVTSPYARSNVNIYELVGEAYPSGLFAFSTALELHRLTEQRSREVHLYLDPSYKPGRVLRQTNPDAGALVIPAGTSAAEWRMQSLPRNVRLTEYEGHTITPHSTKSEWIFGHEVVETNGVAVRCTDIERTLIDGLRYPRHCGGMSEVFRAWVRAERLSPARLVEYAERLDQLILYQRLGFVMETLGLHHDRMEQWKREKSPRGGSRVLNPDRDYSSTYSGDWNLSINHPTAILEARDASYS